MIGLTNHVTVACLHTRITLHSYTITHARCHYAGWSVVEGSGKVVRFVLQVITCRGDARSVYAGRVTHPSNRHGHSGPSSLWGGACVVFESVCVRALARTYGRREAEEGGVEWRKRGRARGREEEMH